MIYDVPQGQTETLDTPITDGSGGAATLTKSGVGELILSADNTYTGATEVQAGTLALGATGSIADSASVAVGTRATLDLSGATSPVDLNALQGAGIVELGADTLVDTQGAAGAAEFSGVISGPGGLTLSAAPEASAGAATLELTGANSYTGLTTIGAGATLQLGNGGTTGSLASAEVTGTGTLIFDESGDVTFGSAPSYTDLQIVQMGVGSLTLEGGGFYGYVTIVRGSVYADAGHFEVGSGSSLYLVASDTGPIPHSGGFIYADVSLNDMGSASGGNASFNSQYYELNDSSFAGSIHGDPKALYTFGQVTLAGASSDFTTNIVVSGILHLTTLQAAGNASNSVDLTPSAGSGIQSSDFGEVQIDGSALSGDAFAHPVFSSIDKGIIDLTDLSYDLSDTAFGSGSFNTTYANSWSALTISNGDVSYVISGSFQDSLTGQYFVQPDGHGGTDVVIADYIAPIATEGGLDQAFQGFSLFAQNGGDFIVTLANDVAIAGPTTIAEVATGDRVVIDQQGHALSDPSGALVVGSSSGSIYGSFSGTLVLGQSSTGGGVANTFGGGVSIVSGLLELASAGAAGSAGIVFAEAASPYAEFNYTPGPTPGTLAEPQTGLQLDQVNGHTIALPNTLYGFAHGDAILLQGETITGLSLGAGNVLAVTEASGATVTLHLDPSESFAGESFGYINTATGGEVGLFAPYADGLGSNVTEYVPVQGDVLTYAETYNPQSAGVSVTSALSGYSGRSVAVGAGGAMLQGAYGELTIAADGTYGYASDVEGLTVDQQYTDTFSLTLSDGLGGLSTETLSFAVTGSALGNAAANIIVGGPGPFPTSFATETLTGLGGADLLVAGPAADIFAYTSAADSPYSTSGPPTFDAIQGFRTGFDHIDVSAADGGGVELVREQAGASAQTFVYFDPGGPAGYHAALDVYAVVQPGDLVTSSTTTRIYDYGDATAGETLDGSHGGAFLVSGGASSDTLVGGAGDVIYGGAGADEVTIGFLAASPVTGAFDVVANFTSEQDKLDLSAADGTHVEIADYQGASFVYFAPSGGAFQGVVEVLGAITPDDLVLDAAARSNGVVIQGDPTLAATAPETLRGGSGADFIYGGSGHDTILGGGGADFLVGGSGADTFVYAALSDSTAVAQDLIDNFDPAKGDLIDLTALDRASGVQGVFVSAFDGHAGEYVLTAPANAGGDWSLLGDLTGSGHPNFQLAFAAAGAATDYATIQAHIHL